MTPEEIKANELTTKYLSQSFDFLYIDTQDGNCIGSCYMTYYSAIKCAIIAVEEILKFQDIMLEEFPSIGYEPVFWKKVLEVLKNKVQI